MGAPRLSHTGSSGENDLAGRPGGEIAERISSAISMGMLGSGERLPPEAELASQFGVAVATLRKALATLRNLGIVETRRGRNGGTFVVQAPFPTSRALRASLRATSTASLRDFFDELAAVSGMAARLAAERTEPSARTRLAEFAFLVREERTAQARARADSRFHLEIAILAQSQRLLAAEQRLQGELTPFLWCEDVCTVSPQSAFNEHLSIAMAIEQQRPDDAYRLAVDHVDSAMRHIIGGKFALHRETPTSPVTTEHTQ